MRTLIQQRSLAQIRRMEIERGLRVEGPTVAASAAAIEDAAEVA
jgi:seryl-tRNA(Sec) selenium transferase